MDDVLLSRRRFLGTGLIGCCAAASPFLTPVTLAAVPGDKRLVVIVLRGAMDGLDVLRPTGDAGFAAMRPTLMAGAPGEALTDYFTLHPAMAGLVPMWKSGELAFAHAVSTPYRDKRSHFEGQDFLEAGLDFGQETHSDDQGWLNRLLQVIPGTTSRTGFAVTREGMRILQGPAPSTSWYPDTELGLSSQAQRLMTRIYDKDELFHNASQAAFGLVAEASQEDEGGGDAASKEAPHLRMADYLAQRLLDDSRIATFSITGWDTHGRQAATIAKPLTELSETLVRLKQGLGPAWSKTAVVAMTEFGRTVRENGTTGTDHGTGGVMLLAGGAIRGGQVYGKWPGIGEGQLYADRDLMPTEDVRAYAAQAMAGLFGLPGSELEQKVFAGLDLSSAPKFIA